MIAVLAFDGILGLLPDAAAGALSGFILVAQIYLILRLFVTVPALVSEESGPFAAVRRSWELTRHSGGRVFGASFVFAIIVFVGFMMASVILQFHLQRFLPLVERYSERDGSHAPMAARYYSRSTPCRRRRDHRSVTSILWTYADFQHRALLRSPHSPRWPCWCIFLTMIWGDFRDFGEGCMSFPLSRNDN